MGLPVRDVSRTFDITNEQPRPLSYEIARQAVTLKRIVLKQVPKELEAVAPFCLRVAFATGQVVTSLMLLLLGCATNLSADPPAEATPQRPTFSNDNSTTAPGTVEVELGGAGNGEFFGLPTFIQVHARRTARRHERYGVQCRLRLHLESGHGERP